MRIFAVDPGTRHLGWAVYDTSTSSYDAFGVFDLQAGAFTTAPPEHPYYLIDEQAIGFNQLLGTTALKAHELKIPRGLRQQLLDKLVRYYQLHLEGMGEVNAHHILREVF